MKLTPSQIATIEKTLVMNEVIYEDIKLELTDHIASEIEAVLTENKVSFNEALVTVFEKWSPELIPSTSFWTPNNMKLPRIVLNKYKVEYKKQFITGSILALVVAISGAYLTKMISNETFFGYLRTGFQTISIVEFTIILISKYLIWKSKTNTFNSFFSKSKLLFLYFYFFYFCPQG